MSRYSKFRSNEARFLSIEVFTLLDLLESRGFEPVKKHSEASSELLTVAGFYTGRAQSFSSWFYWK